MKKLLLVLLVTVSLFTGCASGTSKEDTIDSVSSEKQDSVKHEKDSTVYVIDSSYGAKADSAK